MTDELEKIKSEIERKKAKWKVGETGISKLSPEERRKRLGVIVPEGYPKDSPQKKDSKETEHSD